MFQQEEDLVAGNYAWWQNAAFVSRALVALLHDLERFRQVAVEFGKVGGELSSAEGGYIALGVNVKGQVVTLIGEEGGYTS